MILRGIKTARGEIAKMEPQFDHKSHKDMPHFIIKGTLPSMNEYIAAAARHPQCGAKMKREYMFLASNAIRLGLKRWKPHKPVIMHYVFYEPNMRRDKDNIAFVALKVVHDALQKCDVLKNDGWSDILNFTHDFYVDPKNPRIEVYIEEVTE